MEISDLGPALLVGAAIVILAVVGVRFAGRLGLPGLLLYLVIGLVLGSTVPALDLQNPELATILGYSALILILAHGGLTTSVSNLRPVLWPSLVLATVGVGVSIAIVAVPLIYLMDVDPTIAILLGGALAATDAAAVFSVLRRINLAPRLRTLLEGEAGFNDAPVVVLVTLVASGAVQGEAWQVPFLVLGQLLGGAAAGLAVGFAARWLIPRLALPAVGLYPIAALAMLVGAFGLASLIFSSGFMAVYVAGIVLGSSPNLPHRRGVIGFSDGLAWIAEIGLFVMLGLLAEVERLPASIGIALVAALVLTVFARPLSVLVSLLPFRIDVRSMGFASVAGLRGAVPIVFAAIPLGLGLPGSEVLFDATLIVVLVLTLVQTPALPWLARRMGVAVASEPGELDVDSAPLDDMRAVVLGVDVPRDSRLVGVFVRELGLPDGAAVSLVVHGRDAVVPTPETRIRVGDRLVVVAAEEVRRATERRLRAISKGGRLATWRR